MNILIVDDVPINLMLLGAMLEAEGHAVFTAADGIEALEVLGRQRCDAIISDILMPRMDGYRLCREVRRDERFHLLPFIFYSSTYTSPADARLALDLGGDKFVRKPVSAAEMVAALHEVTTAQSASRPRESRSLLELDVLKEYSERLVGKLEHKNLELSAMAKQLELQATALQTAANAILITDAAGTIKWVNPAFTTITGYSAEEAIGQTPRILKSGLLGKEFYRDFWNTIRARLVWRGEFINRRKDGTIFYDEHTVTPVCDAGGRITHYVGIMHDVTERKLAAIKLKEQSETLLGSNAELQQFNRLAVGRELRVVGLKLEINELALSLGQPQRYDLSFNGEPSPEPQTAAAGTSLTTIIPRNNRILVVDDNPAIHDDFRKILTSRDQAAGQETSLFAEGELEEASFEVDCAAQGQEGLELIRRADAEGKPYGMAFLDIRMPPGWDGVETAKRIWTEFPDLQIVLCTAYSDYSRADLQKVMGQRDQLLILKKPFDVIEVTQFAHTLLEKWRLGQESKHKMSHLETAVLERTREIDASRVAALNLSADAVEAHAALQKSNLDLENQIIAGELTANCWRIAEEKYRSIFENSAEGIFQTSPQGTFIEANPALARILGYESPEKLLRESPDMAGQFHVNPEERREFQQLLAEKGAVQNFECEASRRDKRKIWVSESARAIRNGEGEIVGYEGSLSDITERKRLEDQLRQAQKMEAVGQLAGGIAHDFNNLLMVINGYSNMLLDSGQLRESEAENVKQVYLAGERAANLTRQLLTFSRKQPVQMQGVELDSLVTGVTKMLQRIIGEDIRLQVPKAMAPVSILADAGMIEQILMNLAVNARDAMADGGQLTIETTLTEVSPANLGSHPKAVPGKFACLIVKDTGCGMPPEVLARIFEPFFTTKPLGKGTGMGLATVFGIVEQHHGWIEVDTAVDQGTTFTVYFPLAPLPDTKSGAIEKIKSSLSGGETILMVEDEESVRALAVLILKKYGYRVLEAASGPEALEVWERHGQKIDLLITDMVMPGDMTGRDLTEKLKALKPDLKVIYTSGYSPDLMSQSFGLTSKIPFLQKPCTSTKLATAVRECLDAEKKILTPVL